MELVFQTSRDGWVSPAGHTGEIVGLKKKHVVAAVKELGLEDSIEVSTVLAKRGSISGRQHNDIIRVVIPSLISDRETIDNILIMSQDNIREMG